MSYARLGAFGSQVYVYDDVRGFLCCCFCPLDPNDFHATSGPAMVAHLAEHRAAGHHVPGYVDAGILADYPGEVTSGLSRASNPASDEQGMG